MLILIDNYDSFTFNLYQYLGTLGADVKVFRNNKISLQKIKQLHPTHLVISPGPGDPIKDSGISPQLIKFFNGKIPILGVCLGHQCIGAVYGAKIDRAPRVMHGKMSLINHNGEGLFMDIPYPFEGMRYHSLLVLDPVPEELEVTAITPEGEIMGLRYRGYPTFGVQFHPESILTKPGMQILGNFLKT